MEKAHNHNKKHTDPKVIATKLQAEVDLILANVDEKTMFAEFRENEIFDIQNGDNHEFARHTLDERIMLARAPRVSTFSKIDKKTNEVAKKVSGAGKFAQYLFKPLQY